MAKNEPVIDKEGIKRLPERLKLLEDTSTQEGIDKAAKMGAIAGLVFATSYGLGFLFRFFGESSPITGETVTLEETWIEIGSFALLVILILFLSWRTFRKGFISAILLSIWYVIEISFKIMGGTSNIGWMIAYFFLGVMFFNGVRAGLAQRKRKGVRGEPLEPGST